MEVIELIDKNPQAMALAFKKAKGKKLKIQELGITPDMDEESIELLIETLATAKAVEDGDTMADHVKGQRWYVESLVEFSGMTVQEQLAKEYEDSFANNASEAEMLDALAAMDA
jgi:hypothetical protein